MSETLILAGEGLLGRVIDANGAPVDGLEPLTNVHPANIAPTFRPATGTTAPWATGIKVIDFYAPLARGTSVALLANPGVGMIVMVSELIHRLAEQHHGCAVFAKLDTERHELNETIGQLRESGVERRTVVITGRYESAPIERQRLVQSALTIAEDLAAGGRDVLLVLDDGLVIAETANLLRGRAQTIDGGSLTIVMCFWRHQGTEPVLDQAAAALLVAADVRLVFSRELAQQSIWPAIDACSSSSQLLTAGSADPAHLQAAVAARALLAHDPQMLDTLEHERAQKLILFQSQPFFVAEPFTARPAAYVPQHESIRTFAGIVAGMYDQTAAETLRFIGSAPDPTPGA